MVGRWKQSEGELEENQRVLGSRPGADNIYKVFWLQGGGARTPLECHRGTLEQGAESAKAHTL